MSELEAKTAGALFYTLPSELKVAEQIDPLLRLAVAAINSSGWVWTAESCQGHPDETDLHAPWGHNTEPYLRLACRNRYVAPLLAQLLREAHDDDSTLFGSPQMKLRTRQLKDAWSEVQIYITAHNVATRNRGCQALERFAFSVQRGAPFPTGQLVKAE